MYKEKIYNINSGEITWRDYTSEEIAQIEDAQKKAENELIDIKKREIKRKSALAKLVALGLTEDEIAAL